MSAGYESTLGLEVARYNSGAKKKAEEDSDYSEFVFDTESSVGMISCHDFFTPTQQGRLVIYSDTHEGEIGVMSSPKANNSYEGKFHYINGNMGSHGDHQAPAKLLSTFSDNQSKIGQGMLSPNPFYSPVPQSIESSYSNHFDQ